MKMFGFLKKKLKKVVDSFSKKVDEEAEETKEIIEEIKVEDSPKKVIVEEKKEIKRIEKPVEIFEIKKQPEKLIKKEEKIEQKEEVVEEKLVEEIIFKEEPKEKKETQTKEIIKEAEEKKGFFRKLKRALTTKKIGEKKFDELFWDLELALLENNVAMEVIEKIKSDLKLNIIDKPLPKGKIEDIIISSLRDSISELFVDNFDLVKKIKESSKRPFVICFVGINGSGKTTSIAKIAHLLKENGLSVALAAADTFRAAAIDQLSLHGENLGLKVIKHDYGSDPAAVAFDAIKHAESTKKDVVLIDTAGRIHSNTNLMEELSKIIRVAKPDLKIFVGESITGNDCTEQAKKFNDAVEIDGIILSKADVDDKGGAAISVSYITKKPIIYLGVGQEYSDLELFTKERILDSVGL